ncbi:MAG: hypothetical protein PHC66_02050 [Candidatus Nanoarchaeia archaeon]|nr:hypothetical protein [Candidatus Nanoarchaeia archaeon]MDD5239742.1 hypothetical protein [Candidatus Nanoarchaeia archaeon]
MNSNKIGTYVLVGLIIINVVLIFLIFTPFAAFMDKITGFYPVSTTLFVLGPPAPPNLTVWVEGRIDFENVSVRLNWTPSNSTDVANYILYTTPNYSAGFDFSVPNLTLPNTTLTIVETNASSFNELYYLLRANASYDLQDDNNKTWGILARQLYNTSGGYNMVSIPVESLNRTIKEVFVQNESDYYATLLFRRNDTTGDFEAAVYLGATVFHLDQWIGQFSTVDPGFGYWIKVSRPYKFPAVGEVRVENRTKQLYNTTSVGNFVGWESVTREKIEDVVPNTLTDYNITRIDRRDDATGDFDTVIYLGATVFRIDAWAGQFDKFEPGYGYWLRTDENTVWTYEGNVRRT